MNNGLIFEPVIQEQTTISTCQSLSERNGKFSF